MCTVTYIPQTKENCFILTSNRDEKMHRETIPPTVYPVNGTEISFPKDLQAGGSWIAANNKGRLSCLLNGAFVLHKKQAFHLQSRGKILLEMNAYFESVLDFFAEKDLSDVEPFTIINIENEKGEIKSMHEFVWDGMKKHISELDTNVPKIWSSVTLYSHKDRELRNIWFDKFLSENLNGISPEKVYHFHSGDHTSDQTVNLLMQREGGLKTVSITQVTPMKNSFRMTYSDILNSSVHQTEI
jgi:Transport and Golgi organisation 2